MRVELHIVAGPETGRVIRVGARELLHIGRTDRADVALAADGKLSQVHFEVETDGQFCRLRDAGSANGTLVNGQIVSEFVLKPGDKIAAGNSLFLVKIDGGAELEEVAVAQKAAIAAIPPVLPKGKNRIVVTREPCQTGLSLFRGQVADMDAARVAQVLAQRFPTYLIVDLRKMAVDPSARLANPDYLFNWLPPEAIPLASPIVVACAEFKEGFALLAEGWAHDAVVALFSRTPKDDLLTHLRTQSRADENSIVGLCWPSVLSPLLMYFKPEMVREVLTGIDAVLVEFPDLDETWQIFAEAPFGGILEELGFALESEPAASGNSAPK
jgi:hypothetical protein